MKCFHCWKQACVSVAVLHGYTIYLCKAHGEENFGGTMVFKKDKRFKRSK